MKKDDRPAGTDLAGLLGCWWVGGHCIAVLAVGDRAPAWIRGSAAHGVLSGCLLGLATVSVIGGVREHGQWRVVRWFVAGAFLLGAARFLPDRAGEWTEVAITLAGCALLGVFSRLNASLRCWGDGTGS